MSDANAPAYKKRKAGGRPKDEQIWKHFKQINLPPDKAERDSLSKKNTPKPIRELDMIMQQEQLAAGVNTKKVTTKAIAAAVEASKLVDLTFASASNAAELPSTEYLTEHLQEMSTFSPSKEVELASTDEVLDLFSRYFDADSADAKSRNVVQDSINTDLDFNGRVFEPNYASQPAASPLLHTQAGHTDTFDVRQFVPRC
ncbi:TPA: hypothetical protein ACH3X1_014512 [Trebouxia sp. C0004]